MTHDHLGGNHLPLPPTRFHRFLIITRAYAILFAVSGVAAALVYGIARMEGLNS